MFLNENYPLGIKELSPIAMQAIILSKELIRRGHHVKMFSYIEDIETDGFKAKGIKPTIFNILHPKLLRKYIQEFDILHLHFLIRAYTTFIPLIKPFISKILIGTAYGSDIRHYRKFLKHRLLLKYILKTANHMILADPDLEKCIEPFFNNNEKISVIPSAIDTNNFVPGVRPPEDLKEIIQDRTVVLFNARLDPIKDPITLLKAIPFVLKREKNIVFLIAGDGILRHEVEKIRNKIEFKDQVFLLGWRNDTPNLLSTSDIFLQLSPVENIWATSLMEAMMMGKGIIATDVGYTKRFLKDKKHAFLIKPMNATDLAAKIIALSKHEELRIKMGKNCRKYALENFSLKKVVDKVENIYFHEFNRKH